MLSLYCTKFHIIFVSIFPAKHILYRKNKPRSKGDEKMEHIIDVAGYVCEEYHRQYGSYIGETMLHKLLYLCQREMLAIVNEPMFEEAFEGWMHGPVNTSVRSHYDKNTHRLDVKTNEISNEAKYIVNNVLAAYGGYTANKLSELTHSEISWQNARKGLDANEPGREYLSIDDIRRDAAKVRPYDHVWDMYYDEFEDAEAGKA